MNRWNEPQKKKCVATRIENGAANKKHQRRARQKKGRHTTTCSFVQSLPGDWLTISRVESYPTRRHDNLLHIHEPAISAMVRVVRACAIYKWQGKKKLVVALLRRDESRRFWYAFSFVSFTKRTITKEYFSCKQVWAIIFILSSNTWLSNEINIEVCRIFSRQLHEKFSIHDHFYLGTVRIPEFVSQ